VFGERSSEGGAAVKDKTTGDGLPRADEKKSSSSQSGSKSTSHSQSKSKSQSQSKH